MLDRTFWTKLILQYLIEHEIGLVNFLFHFCQNNLYLNEVDLIEFVILNKKIFFLLDWSI